MADTTILVNPEQMSSVEIESRAKGAPKITVKVYDADPAAAASRAVELYERLAKRYGEELRIYGPAQPPSRQQEIDPDEIE